MDKALRKYYLTVSLYVALLFAVLAAFWQVRHCEFITTFDDDVYVIDNSYVKAGPTAKSLAWAFTSAHAHNWHPLTWISHMLDCRLYGLNAGGHHLTNLLIHIVNTLLLLFVLNRMTGNLWSSAFVAAIFGLHPLHVESVAWVSERKDVLSAFFWLLTMLAYLRYTKRPDITRYLPVVLIFCLGLMAKQMLVTLPIVLLLLDYWPLERFKSVPVGRCVLEKAPLFILSIAAGVIAYTVQERTGMVRPFIEYSLVCRVGNALVAYMQYIGMMFWPVNLAVFYPHPGNNLPAWQVAGSVLLLFSATAGAVWKIRQRPYLAVGWFWYLITLVPVIGLVQVGMQAFADRYTYIPFIGLSIIIAWVIADFVSRLSHRNAVLWPFLLAVAMTLGLATRRQVGYWRDDMTLYRHSAAAVQNNWWAHFHIGELLVRENRLDEAIEELGKALRIKPGIFWLRNNLGAILLRQGKFDEAIVHLGEAVRINPEFAIAQNNFGNVLAIVGRNDDAIKHYTKSLQLNWDQPHVHYNLANILLKEDEAGKAARHYYEALKLKPDFLEARENLAKALAQQSKLFRFHDTESFSW